MKSRKLFRITWILIVVIGGAFVAFWCLFLPDPLFTVPYSTVVLDREGEVITQSFMTDRDFNEIQVTLKGSSNVEKNSYEFEVVDQKGNVVCKQSFPFKQKIVDKRMIFDFDTVRGDGTNRSYSIRITCKKEQKQGIEIGHSPLLSYDVYTKGEMKKNNTMKLTDMRFMVSCKNRF